MNTKIFSKSCFAGTAARGVVLASCLFVAPLALADSQPSAPDGAGYLLSYSHHYYKGGSTSASNFVGNATAMDTPEPATWGMFGIGLSLIGFGAATRRRRSMDT